MKRVEAKIEENRKEDSASEPDKDPNTWLIEAKVDEDIFDWENVRLEFQIAEFWHRNCNSDSGEAVGREELEENGFHVARPLG